MKRSCVYIFYIKNLLLNINNTYIASALSNKYIPIRLEKRTGREIV
jgi:hypothetical protein